MSNFSVAELFYSVHIPYTINGFYNEEVLLGKCSHELII